MRGTAKIGVCGWEEQKRGRGIETNGLSKRSKASQPSIFGVLGRLNRPQLSCFCPHLFRPFLISKLRRSHCSAFPASEEVVADKKASFLSCSPEWLRSSSAFLFLPAANPKYPRTVAADNTIGFAKQRLQLLPDQQRRSYAKARVQVHEHFDGHLSVHYAGRCVATTEAPLEAPKVRARSGPRGGTAALARSQTPSSAVVLLNPASTAELGESGPCPADQPTAARRPIPTHPWRKPLLKPKGTKSLNT